MDPKDLPETEQPEQLVEDDKVTLDEASIEDLDAELERLITQEKSGAPVEGQAEVSQEPSESNATNQPTGQPAPANPVQAGVATQGATPSKPLDTTPKRVYTEEEIQGIIADRERLENKGKQKELFIQHQGNELGALRQTVEIQKAQLNQLRTGLVNGLKDRFYEDPALGLSDTKKIEKIDSELEALDRQVSRAATIAENRELFLRHIDINQVSPDDIADVLRHEGVGEQYIEQFKTNPWEWTSGETLIQLGRRAIERKEYRKADEDRRILAQHVLRQNAELERLRKRPQEVLSRVQRNLNSTPSVTSASVSSPQTKGNFDSASLDRMSIAELDAALKHATSRMN